MINPFVTRHSTLLGPQFKGFSIVDHKQCLPRVTEFEHLDGVSSFVTMIKRVLSKTLEPYFIEVFIEDVCVGESCVAGDGKRWRNAGNAGAHHPDLVPHALGR